MATFIDRLNFAVAQREGELGTRILKKDLAAAAGVSSSAVTLWFQGKTEELKAASLLGLASYLKVRVEWLRDKDGPMRATGAAAAHLEKLSAAGHSLDGLSREARKLIDLIAAADRAKLLTKETLNAFTVILGQASAHSPAPVDLTSARSIERAEALVASHQPKRQKGKGAA